MKSRHKELKQWLIMLCASIIVYALVSYFPFPVAESRLYEASSMQLRSASQSTDSKINCMETPGKSSVYYWILNDSGIFLVPAEKSPFWNRYRLFDTMMFRPGEIYKSKDFFYKITIQHNGEILSLSFQRSPDPLLLSAGFSVFVICINVAYAWKKRS